MLGVNTDNAHSKSEVSLEVPDGDIDFGTAFSNQNTDYLNVLSQEF